MGLVWEMISFGLVVGEAAGVGETSEVFLVGVEVFDGIFGAYEDHD